MINKEDEARVIEFAQDYRNRAKKVNELKDQLEDLKGKITVELNDMQGARENELKFLDDLRDKYETTPEAIIQLIQKIIMTNV